MSQDGEAVADIVKRLPISRRKVLLVTCAAQDLTAVTSLPGASVQVFLGGPGEIGDFSRGLREEKITLKKWRKAKVEEDSE